MRDLRASLGRERVSICRPERARACPYAGLEQESVVHGGSIMRPELLRE